MTRTGTGFAALLVVFLCGPLAAQSATDERAGAATEEPAAEPALAEPTLAEPRLPGTRVEPARDPPGDDSSVRMFRIFGVRIGAGLGTWPNIRKHDQRRVADPDTQPELSGFYENAIALELGFDVGLWNGGWWSLRAPVHLGFLEFRARDRVTVGTNGLSGDPIRARQNANVYSAGVGLEFRLRWFPNPTIARACIEPFVGVGAAYHKLSITTFGGGPADKDIDSDKAWGNWIGAGFEALGFVPTRTNALHTLSFAFRFEWRLQFPEFDGLAVAAPGDSIDGPISVVLFSVSAGF